MNFKGHAFEIPYILVFKPLGFKPRKYAPRLKKSCLISSKYKNVCVGLSDYYLKYLWYSGYFDDYNIS